MSGNSRFVEQSVNTGDIGPKRRAALSQEGQAPFAVVVACSDSRVVPEHVFDCGLGDLFVVRTAGNTIGPSELGSVVYATTHLGCKLVVVMGHTQCGAVAAALAGGESGAVSALTDRICEAIGSESDPVRASIANVEAGLSALRLSSEIAAQIEQGLLLKGALHHIDIGRVEFL